MRKLIKQNKGASQAWEENRSLYQNHRSKTQHENLSSKKGNSYVRRFFERRDRLEMEVRERIFREGRSQSRKQFDIRQKYSQKQPQAYNNKKQQKKREENKCPNHQKKPIASLSDDSLTQSKYLPYPYNEKLKEDSTTKTTKEPNKWQRDNLILENFQGMKNILEKTEIQSKFRKMYMRRNFEEVGLRDREKKERKCGYIMTNQKLKQVQRENESDDHTPEYIYNPEIQKYQQKSRHPQTNSYYPQLLQTTAKKQPQFDSPEPEKQPRNRSNGFKIEIHNGLREKLAMLVSRQKEVEKLRNFMVEVNMKSAGHTPKSEHLGGKIVIESIFRTEEKQMFREEEQQIREQKQQKEVHLRPQKQKQSQKQQARSQIICAICQTNIPHSLWQHATFYNKNRVEYYNYYELFLDASNEEEKKAGGAHQQEGEGQSQVEDEEQAIPLLLHCGHSYHRICLEQWFRYKTVCPLCKTEHDDGQASEVEDGDVLDGEVSWSSHETSYFYQHQHYGNLRLFADHGHYNRLAHGIFDNWVDEHEESSSVHLSIESNSEDMPLPIFGHEEGDAQELNEEDDDEEEEEGGQWESQSSGGVYDKEESSEWQASNSSNQFSHDLY